MVLAGLASSPPDAAGSLPYWLCGNAPLINQFHMNLLSASAFGEPKSDHEPETRVTCWRNNERPAESRERMNGGEATEVGRAGSLGDLLAVIDLNFLQEQ